MKKKEVFPNLASYVLLDEVIFPLVAEDDMDLLCWTADIRTKHDVVRGLTMEIRQVNIGAHYLIYGSN